MQYAVSACSGSGRLLMVREVLSWNNTSVLQPKTSTKKIQVSRIRFQVRNTEEHSSIVVTRWSW